MANAKGIVGTDQLRDGDIVKLPARAFLGRSHPSNKVLRAIVLSPADDREVYADGENLRLCPIVTKADAEGLLRSSARLVEITDKWALGLPEGEDWVVVCDVTPIRNSPDILGRNDPNTIDHAGTLERTHPDWEKVVDSVYPETSTRRSPTGYATADITRIIGGRAQGGLSSAEESDIASDGRSNRGTRGPRKKDLRSEVSRPDIGITDFIRIFDPSEGLRLLFNKLAAEKPGILFTEALDYIEANRAEAERVLAEQKTEAKPKEPTIKEILDGGLLDAPELKPISRIKKFLKTFIDGQGAEGGEYAHIKTLSDFIKEHQKTRLNNQPLADWLFRFKGVGASTYQDLAQDITRLAAHFKGSAPAPTNAQNANYEDLLREAKGLRGQFLTESLALNKNEGTDNLSADALRSRYTVRNEDGTERFAVTRRIVAAPRS